MSLIELAGLAPAIGNFLVSFFEHCLIVHTLPLDEFLNDLEEAVAFELSLLFVHSPAKSPLIAWVVDHLGKDDCTRSREGAPCPPQMQVGWVSVADRLLASCAVIDAVERQGDFDQFFWCFDVHLIVLLPAHLAIAVAAAC